MLTKVLIYHCILYGKAEPADDTKSGDLPCVMYRIASEGGFLLGIVIHIAPFKLCLRGVFMPFRK